MVTSPFFGITFFALYMKTSKSDFSNQPTYGSLLGDLLSFDFQCLRSLPVVFSSCLTACSASSLNCFCRAESSYARMASSLPIFFFFLNSLTDKKINKYICELCNFKFKSIKKNDHVLITSCGEKQTGSHSFVLDFSSN